MNKPFVTAVVLNYKHAADTISCVQSLGRSTYRRLSTIVVDNGSGNEVVHKIIDRVEPTVSTLVSEENLGYAAGNNIGIQAALDRGADLVWIVNPDVVAEEDALAAAILASDRRPDAGIIGSRIFYGASDPPKIWFNGGIIDWKRAGATSHRDMGALDSKVVETSPFAVDYVTGASMLVRAEVFEDVGLLPERYFLYFEETEFNLNVQSQGWATVVAPLSRLWHFKRSTGPLPAPYYVYYFIRNRIVFGTEFAGVEPTFVVDDLQDFVSAWRAKVNQHAPAWVEVYDRLVETATAHGIEGRSGRWLGLDDVEPPKRAS